MNEHQHRQQLEEARQQAICDRLDKVEDRLGTVTSQIQRGWETRLDILTQVEFIADGLELHRNKIEKLQDRLAKLDGVNAVRMPQPDMRGVEDVMALSRQLKEELAAIQPLPDPAFGEATAKMTAALRDDLDTICGRDPRNDMVGVFVHSGRNADYDLNWSIECDEASSKLFTRDQLRALGIAGVTRAVRENGRFGGSWLELEIEGQTHRYNDMAPDTIVNTVQQMKRYRDLARREAEKGTYPTYAEQQEKRANHPTATELRETIRAGSQSMADQINRFAGMAAAAISPQRAYNRRMSELMARVAADQERIMAFWALRDRLTRAGFLLTFEREIDALWKSLGSPNRSVDDDQQKAQGDGEA